MAQADGTAESDAWLFVYGPALPANRLLGIVGGRPPLASFAAVAEAAWLSFDVRGVPYYEPCRTSLIIRGVNDTEAPRSEKAKLGDPTSSIAYRQWIHERCSPGKHFEGALPPPAEGMAYLVTSSQLLAWLVYHSTFGHPSLSSSPRFVPLHVRPSVDSGVSVTAETRSDAVLVHTLIAPASIRMPNLQPVWDTMQAPHAVWSMSMPGSKAYATSITGCRSYSSSKSDTAKLIVTLLVLLPAFALCYAPFALRRRPIPWWAAFSLEQAIAATWILERYMSPVFGSGYIDL